MRKNQSNLKNKTRFFFSDFRSGPKIRSILPSFVQVFDTLHLHRQLLQCRPNLPDNALTPFVNRRSSRILEKSFGKLREEIVIVVAGSSRGKTCTECQRQVDDVLLAAIRSSTNLVQARIVRRPTNCCQRRFEIEDSRICRR